MNKWRTAGLMVTACMFGSSVSSGAIYLYWKNETPPPLRPLNYPMIVRTLTHESRVVNIPTKQYEYLGSYVFNTETLDAEGLTVWATPWVQYNPHMTYKFVAPVGLETGEFSVMMNIDYALNPVARANGSVKFLNLIIEKENADDSNVGSD